MDRQSTIWRQAVIGEQVRGDLGAAKFYPGTLPLNYGGLTVGPRGAYKLWFMLRDIRFTLRMLARNPGVTALATIALALGIGGSTLIFSVVNAVLLRPLPVSDANRLVWIWADSPSRNLAYAFTAYSTYAEWKAGSASFESMSAYSPGSATLITGNDAERMDLLRVNASFFPMLGVHPFCRPQFSAGRGSAWRAAGGHPLI